MRRWLAAPVVMPGGGTGARDRGTPRGPCVSPVPASLFMHCASGTWPERGFPAVTFGRFAGGAVVRCATERQAGEVLSALGQGMAEAGLHLHPDKTTIVCCRDRERRRADCAQAPFTFPGCTFRAGNAPDRDGTGMFTGFLPAAGKDALKRMSGEVRSRRIRPRTGTELQDLAARVSPVGGGRLDYHGRYRKTALDRPPRRISTCLMRRARRRYKRLRPFRKALRRRARLTGRQPRPFARRAWTAEVPAGCA